VQVFSVLSRTGEWTFDSFELEQASGGRSLSTLAFALIKRTGIATVLKLNEGKLAR
jgi:hypothetical protein